MKIITPVRPSNFEDFERLFLQINYRADIIEIWLDGVKDIDVFFVHMFVFVNNLAKKDGGKSIQFLGVCKFLSENGKFIGDESEKFKLLHRFLDLGGCYIDLDVTRNSTDGLRSFSSKKLFLSFHDFEAVPDDLESIFMKMKRYDPFMYKFAVTVNSENELDHFMQFIKKFPSNMNVIFTTMGRFGEVGREQISGMKKSWGGFFSIDLKQRTANGQKTLNDL